MRSIASRRAALAALSKTPSSVSRCTTLARRSCSISRMRRLLSRPGRVIASPLARTTRRPLQRRVVHLVPIDELGRACLRRRLASPCREHRVPAIARTAELAQILLCCRDQQRGEGLRRKLRVVDTAVFLPGKRAEDEHLLAIQ